MRTQQRSVVAGLLLALVVISGGVQSTSSLAFASGTDSSQYFARMNQERAEHGRAALAWRSDLADIAQAWAQHMSSAQELAHNPDLTQQVHNWRAVGENVGDGPTIDDLDHAFMNSAEHRDNILDSEYTEVGVGSVRDSNGVIWITIDFRDPMVRQPAPSPAHATAAAIAEHWSRGATVVPAAPRAPVTEPHTTIWTLMRSTSWPLPLAPGCMLRLGWF